MCLLIPSSLEISILWQHIKNGTNMPLTDREKTIVSTAVLAAVGVGTLCVIINRKRLFRRFTDPFYNQTVEVITNSDECQKIVGTLRSHCQEYRVLGLDCEWVSEQGKRHPVALLQLASHRGLCALFRLCEIRRIPTELSDLLNDPTILKVASAFDLRHLAEKAGIPGPYGMARLAQKTLGFTMDKHWRVRASNWENPELSQRQIAYAANDVHVAVELFERFAKRVVPRGLLKSRKDWYQQVLSEVDCYLDQRYTDKPSGRGSTGKGKNKLLGGPNGANINTIIKRSMATRAKPLYDNCLMQAPDGELLCTCDRKKAEWYVIKELAEIVADQPTYTIRLKFEPKGRAVGDVGRYYQIPKENRCVVCGAKDSYIRKNVVPRDYRKHFPLVMKEHISHDVLLLCAPCHRKSTMSDENMRLKLTSMCTAPYSTQENPKEIRVENMSDLRKAARALFHFSDKIPEERRKSLERKVKKLVPKGTEINKEMLEHYANINVTIANEEYCAHGAKVVEYFKQTHGGLSELERMWREHFLRIMKPKHMPDLWSVEHNFKRLEIRADEGRVDEQDLLVAGVKRPILNGSSSNSNSSNSISLTFSNSSSNSKTFSLGTISISNNSLQKENTTDNDSTARDFPTYADEEAASTTNGSELAVTQSNINRTEFFSNRDETKHGATAYESATAGGSSGTSLGNSESDPFRTLAPSASPSTLNAVELDESEQEATVNDFASIESSYDSDDSDSTLSQPSMTLLNSTDDWEAEANEPSVNGTLGQWK
ncbi:exonuclease 3'-5' domain-containing protein 2 isoform X2 [Wyeomyia smithii]|uniref:exonuclease 3'-5' domain-containing protein 2 isoform X2 n=1 Tax=Wyeomyia smithii TaxID=174621 RepID=UPI002467E9FD|nr:exonuclease 3'-5' domain-containing protein 2 isoform X2 [Wyeomyia smithii]